MSATTGIEWTDSTWNPIIGCSRVSEGCRNCYAELMAARFSKNGQWGHGIAEMHHGKPTWTGTVQFVEEHLLDPLKWKRPRRIFVNSTSDLFHENVTDLMRDRIFAVMALCPQHTFQVLTKRPERMLAYLASSATAIRIASASVILQTASMRWTNPCGQDGWWPLPNVWLGVSLENQDAADKRIPLLLQTPAAVRFLSCEPMLGAVRMDRIGEEPEGYINALAAVIHCDGRGTKSITGLDWVIAGGESGPNARPMHPAWARTLRDQCVAAGVPFFFKQHGEWISLADYDCFKHGTTVDQYQHQFAWQFGSKNDAELPISCYRVGKQNAGSLLDGREWKQFPGVTA